ncbi:hypothetical protein [Paludisphaera soli]|uniref:hypothetical protein n=1 Tax=Paludisphaera soli TaxID=2712865 RepID=UPI0013EA64F2|nr:hypothetical protein [Paludisphaera soli]
MLSAETAKQIVRSVVRSSPSRKRIDSTLARVMPNRLGLTGSLRNLGMIAMGYQGDEPEAAALSCVGIADVTTDDVKAAKIAGVREVRPHSREYLNIAHTATLIVMDDGSEYVFDWHATLQSSDPLIFKRADWDRGKGGVRYSGFKGLD